MVVEVSWYSLGVIAGIIVILVYQLTRFSKSEKPYFVKPENLMIRREVERNSLGESIYSEERQYSEEEFEIAKKKANHGGKRGYDSMILLTMKRRINLLVRMMLYYAALVNMRK